MLVAGSGLLVATLANFERVDPGFDTAGVVSAPPFIGSWVHLMPSFSAICSIVMWSVVPAPGVA